MDAQIEAKIKAIKTLREIAPRHGFTGNGGYLGLKEAKDIIDILAPIFTASDSQIAAAQAAQAEAERAAECARNDLHTLIRLVDYMVANPQAWAEWKANA